MGKTPEKGRDVWEGPKTSTTTTEPPGEGLLVELELGFTDSLSMALCCCGRWYSSHGTTHPTLTDRTPPMSFYGLDRSLGLWWRSENCFPPTILETGLWWSTTETTGF